MQEQNILKQAIEEENLERVREILTECPQLIETADEEGTSLCFVAAKTGNLSVVRYLVEYSRASMNVTDRRHRNILHYAVLSGNRELVEYLVERVGMSPLSGDEELVTPYDLAAQNGLEAIAGYFAERTGFSYDEAYHNPVRTGFFPDPSVVRVGEDYYMVNSSFIFFPCIPISHSRDLVHWEIIGHAITNPEWAMLDELEGGRGYWAPDISYYRGKFYICATYRLNDTGTVYRKQMVVSAEKPEGPYSKPVFLDEDGIDPSLFADEDGRRYMLLNRGARIFEVNEDATEQIGEATLLYYGDYKRAPEGPHLLKKDGYYYLFEAEGGTGAGHRITVSRARNLFGVYEPCPYNPIMRQQDEDAPLQRCGHGKPVQTAAGDWYMIYLCGRRLAGKYSILGRETALDPITWTADGWPIVNGLKGPSALQKRPVVPACETWDCDTDRAGKNDGFGTGDTLSPEWMTPRPPTPDGITVRDGMLLLQGSREPLDRVSARNILLRRQTAFSFDAETCLKNPELDEGQEAGLICYYDENTWVSCGLKKEKGSLTVQVHEHIGERDVIHDGGNIPGDFVTICFRVETRGLCRTFFCKVDDSGEKRIAGLPEVYYLCDEGYPKGKRFTGALTGVFAYAGGRKKAVMFTNFKTVEKKEKSC